MVFGSSTPVHEYLIVNPWNISYEIFKEFTILNEIRALGKIFFPESILQREDKKGSKIAVAQRRDV